MKNQNTYENLEFTEFVIIKSQFDEFLKRRDKVQEYETDFYLKPEQELDFNIEVQSYVRDTSKYIGIIDNQNGNRQLNKTIQIRGY